MVSKFRAFFEELKFEQIQAIHEESNRKFSFNTYLRHSSQATMKIPVNLHHRPQSVMQDNRFECSLVENAHKTEIAALKNYIIFKKLKLERFPVLLRSLLSEVIRLGQNLFWFVRSHTKQLRRLEIL